MKKLFTILALLVSAASGWAQEVVIDKIHYSLYDNDGVTEAFVCGSDEDIVEANILANVTIEGVEYAVTRIKDGAFMDRVSLVSAIIPEGVRALNEWNIFFGSSLTEISIPSTCVIIDLGFQIFPESLSIITISEANPTYYVENNCIIEKASKKLIATTRNSTIPSDIQALGNWSLRGWAVNKTNNYLSWTQEYPARLDVDGLAGRGIILQVPEGMIPRYLFQGWCNGAFKTVTDGTSTFYCQLDWGGILGVSHT